MATTPHAAHTRANMYGLARHAKHYERWAGLLATPLYRRVVADVAAARLPVGASVLDVGTGPGRVPMMIAERCPQLSVYRHRSVTGDDRPGHRRRGSRTGRSLGQSFQVADVADPAVRRRVDGSGRVLDQHAPLGRPRRRAARHRPGAPTRCPGLDLRLRPMIRRTAPMTLGLGAVAAEIPLTEQPSGSTRSAGSS